MTRKGFLSIALLPFFFKRKPVNPYKAQIAGVALVALDKAAKAAVAMAKENQTILVGGEIKWNGNTLRMALDKAYKRRA